MKTLRKLSTLLAGAVLVFATLAVADGPKLAHAQAANPTSAQSQQTKASIVVPKGEGKKFDRNGVICESWSSLGSNIVRCPITKDGKLVGYRLEQTITGGGVGVPTIQDVDLNGKPLTDATTVAGPGVLTTDKDTGKVSYDSPVNAVVSAVVGTYTCIADGPVDCLIDSVGTAIVMIATFFLGIAGVFFNAAVVKTVFGFSTLLGNSPGLLQAWGILRDLANMALLFGFIFIGVSTILNLNTYSAKKALPRLLIFAVAMNFSLFASQAVIDISNVMSSVIYNQGTSGSCFGGDDPVEVTGTGTYTDTAYNSAFQESVDDCLLEFGIAGSFMDASGLSSIFKLELGDRNEAVKNIAFLTTLALVATIGAIVFFAAGLMIVIRAITLTFLMLISPLGFAALAIPQFNSLGKKWWEKLISQSFFAPIMILLMLISIKLAEGLGSVGGQGMAAALAQPNTSTMLVFLLFALVMGFMIASLIAAQRFGASGSAFAVKLATNLAVGGAARGFSLTTNLAGRGGRVLAQRGVPAIAGGIGAGARGIAGRANVRGRFANSTFSQTRFGQKVGSAAAFSSGLANRVANADTTKAIGKFAKDSGKVAVMSTFGKMEKANMDPRRLKLIEKNLAKMGAGTAAKPSTKYNTLDSMSEGLDELSKRRKETVEAYDKQVKDRQKQKDIQKLEKRIEENPDSDISNDDKKFIMKLSVKELEELDGIKSGVRQLVENLSPEKFDALLKSDKLTGGEKNKLIEGRFASVSETAGQLAEAESRNDQAAAGVQRDRLRNQLGSMSKKDMQRLPSSLIQNAAFLKALSEDQRKDAAESQERTSTEVGLIRSSSPVEQFKIAFDSNEAGVRDAAIRNINSSLNPTQIAKLDKRFVLDPDVVKQLSKRALIKLQESNTLKDAEVETISRIVSAGGTQSAKDYINNDGAAYWR